MGLRRFVVAAAAAGAVSAAENEDLATSDIWQPFPTPQGIVYIHKDCIHHVADTFHVAAVHGEGDNLTTPDGSSVMPPCPHEPRRLESSQKVDEVKYYSDWAAYAVDTHSGGYGYMSSDWKVPKAPSSTGPVPGISSSYLFNGLEDGMATRGQASYIMQPVLSYGKSGCIINPLSFFQWHLVSFYVTGAGRAYCGAKMAVKEGEIVRGSMALDGSSNTWRIDSVRLSTNQTSTHSVTLDKNPDSAYITLETMVNYGCKDFPSSGSVDFVNNVLKDRSGKTVSPSWKPLIRHSECNQAVKFSGSDVTISWNTQANSDDTVVV